TSDYSACKVLFGNQRGRLVSASASRVIAAVPDYGVGESGGGLRLISGATGFAGPFQIGGEKAGEPHPGANPPLDLDEGSIYVPLSGQPGQKVPFWIYKISPDDTVSPFISDVVNPTGMAFSREGVLYVTSRYDGSLYRISPFKEVQTVASDLGIATGLAFDHKGDIYVGDRTGTIFPR